MINLERLIWRIKQDESNGKCILKSFWDNKQWTNGWGTEAKYENEVITEVEANRRLQEYIIIAINDVVKLFKEDEYKINDTRMEAFVNMRYNLGFAGLKNFKNMIKEIKKEIPNWHVVAYHAGDSKWMFIEKKDGTTVINTRALRLCMEIASGNYFYSENEVTNVN